MDREKIIEGLEDTQVKLTMAVDRGGEMSVMSAFNCLNNVTRAIALLKEHEHEVCENCPYKLEDIGDFSDGYHTFNDLYMQRAVLFATIVNQNLDKAWKSHKHEDGEPCFGGGWFIVAVDTPKGSYSYHYEDKYWDIFKCVELPVAKHWDGHTDKDVWRLLLLT